MVEAARRAPVAFLGSEFDAFLFAPVGEDRNGMMLSVASALARQDVDPWREAANLAGLPGEAARRRLASLIAALPDRRPAPPDPGTIAARLLELLPGRAGAAVPSGPWWPRSGAGTRSQRAVKVLFCVVALAFTVSLAFVMARDGPAPPIENDHVAAAPEFSPPISQQQHSNNQTVPPPNGNLMTKDNADTTVNEKPVLADPEEGGQQDQQNQSDVAAPPGQPAAPGRRPLFRN